MKLKPSESLTENDVEKGLKLVIADGLFAESMVSFTGGAFLVAMAIHLGATNFQLGVLAALPTFSSIFQLVSVWLVRRYNNRRAVTVIFSFLARFPLFVIGLLPFLFTTGTSVYVLIFFLFFHYYFGSVAGASWNSWMRDLVPTEKLGTYFSHRSRLTQSLNVVLSLAIAFSIDYIKLHYPDNVMLTYSIMFLIGGTFGMLGIYMLAKTPEPKLVKVNDNFFNLLKKPLKDRNFRRFIAFNSFWAFSLNLATPFFSVYMMKTLNIELSFIIAFAIVCQISSIFSIKMWGRLSDRFSNKTIINICAPVYILCILSWVFTGMVGTKVGVLGILAGINILTGISTAGVNLAMGNVGMKLAPRSEAIAFLSVKNVSVAFFSSIAPLIGGLMADFFATHELVWSFEWKGAEGTTVLPLINLKGWSFFFIIGGTLAFFSLKLLARIREEGEVQKDRVVVYMRSRFTRRLGREAKAVYKGESWATLKKNVASWTYK